MEVKFLEIFNSFSDMSIYRQGEFLGKGGFGEVYKATYGPDELVIKILKSSTFLE
jgi:predicted Ser/Thr protein kinase